MEIERPSVAGASVEVLKCLKKYGQRLDVEIAREMEMPLESIRERLSGLKASGAVVTCSLTRFENGKKVDAWQCRVSGYVPPVAPGRKPKPTP
jgi:DNA-binding IclR family transcriptional regulator